MRSTLFAPGSGEFFGQGQHIFVPDEALGWTEGHPGFEERDVDPILPGPLHGRHFLGPFFHGGFLPHHQYTPGGAGRQRGAGGRRQATAMARTGEPVAPRIFRGRAAKKNS